MKDERDVIYDKLLSTLYQMLCIESSKNQQQYQVFEDIAFFARTTILNVWEVLHEQ